MFLAQAVFTGIDAALLQVARLVSVTGRTFLQ